MSDIFVSYAKKDRDRVQSLVGALEASGWSVFWDPVIPVGKTWREVIGTKLAESGCVVVVWSRSSITSHWVLEEAEIGRQRGILVPVLIDAVLPPLGFQGLQAADLTGWVHAAEDTAIVDVTNAITRLIGPSAVLEQDPSGQVFSPTITTSSPWPDPDFAVVTDMGIKVTKPLEMEFMRVPAGEFLMGSDRTRDPFAHANELPQHPVKLSEFFIGKYEVTNTQYTAFVEASGQIAPRHWQNGSVPSGLEDHPVVYVSWEDAVAFSEWLSINTEMNFRLPTEAEWEKACRGTDGAIYPWGDSEPDAEKLNYDRNVGVTTKVGSYSPQGDSPNGATDMAGNVWEWTSSIFMDYPYDDSDGRENMEDRDASRVLRGGAFFFDQLSVRCACRYDSPTLRTAASTASVFVWLPPPSTDL